ncbi:MAG: nucleoside 2-deoxyribosyltransferase [Alphaproteobacteria bacterium]|nr:nucleoside 2-deoxyribosyltransferase [Alphaproteobacteria bacterium]MCW5743248.1 nucleoside 2-deoxyribosyltransferase [Alphaproteobacteria bacterium]
MFPRKNVYLASPLFSEAERTYNEHLCKTLQRWCDVFLPQRDGELVPHLVKQGLSPSDAYRVVFERDIRAIRACDALVINLDGRAVDEGAAFELGVAHALGKRCVGIRTDPRVLLQWGLNPMIAVPLSETFSCLEMLEDWAKAFGEGSFERPRLVR